MLQGTRQGDGTKTLAATESGLRNLGNTLRNSDGIEQNAGFECLFTYITNRGGDGEILEVGLISKSARRNANRTFAQNKGGGVLQQRL